MYFACKTHISQMLQHVVYIVTAVFNRFNEATYFLIGDVQTAEIAVARTKHLRTLLYQCRCNQSSYKHWQQYELN
jgi:hypothetical protein